MNQALRHFSVRIWFSLLIGGLVCLWLLPHVQGRIGIERSLFAVITILVLVYFGIGWISTQWGVKSVIRLVRQAGACERDGMYAEAELFFRNAMSVFDSFLISPFVKRKKSSTLAARVARFYLARPDKHLEFESFLVTYLYDHPEDEEAAENWINQIQNRGGLREEHQELAYRIGTAQPQNETIQYALARFFLLMERTDFPALQTYRRILDRDDPAPPEFIDNLADLFFRERRTDEWALKAYLQAYGRDENRRKLLRGIAACLRLTPETERNRHLLQTARSYLEGIGDLQLKEMSAGFKPPEPPPAPPKRRRGPGIGEVSGQLMQNFARGFIRGVQSASVWTVERVKSLRHMFKQSRNARRLVAGTVLVGLSAIIAVLIINTIGHLTRTQKSAKLKKDPAAVVMTDPFTIQVAAYLKPDYAKRYVVKLKKQGLDAYWTEAEGGNKRWYQVRVSHFKDKASARAYGESLKAKGVINDYYVANYQRP
jgi:hypothetical protein